MLLAGNLNVSTATGLTFLCIWRDQYIVNVARLGEAEAELDKLLLKLRQLRDANTGMRGAVAAKGRLTAKLVQGTADKMSLEVDQIRASMTDVQGGTVSALQDWCELFVCLGPSLTNLLPTRFTCNNWRCTNLATTSEAFRLVRGKACACAGCLAGTEGTAPPFCFAARYCSVACQAEQWPQHKQTCRRLRQLRCSMLQQAPASVPEPAG